MEDVGVVADTGPLVALAKADSLGLLPLLFSTIFIPPAVERELTAKRSAESRRLQNAFGKFLQTIERPELAPAVRIVTSNLDVGEAEAIAVAYNRGLWLLVDDKLGRRAASRLNIQIVGSVSVVLEAKRRGHLPLVLPIFLEMRRMGYWLSDDLIAQAVAQAGEREWPG